MFSTKEQEIIKYGLQNGKSQQEVTQAISNYRLGIVPNKANTSQGGDTFSDIKQIGTDVKNSVLSATDKVQESLNAGVEGKQGALETTSQIIGQGAKVSSDIIGDVVKGGVKTLLPQETETTIKEGLQKTVTPVLQSKAAQDVITKYNNLNEKSKRNVDSLIGFGSLALDIATLGGGKKVGEVALKESVKTGTKALETGAKVTEELLNVSKDATSKVVQKLATPKPTAIEAVGEVLQGKPKDIKAGIKGLSAIDTKGVKTFEQLENTVNKTITKLALRVDKDLAVDTTKKLLKDLFLSAKTSAGTVVKTNPVERALKQLNELYLKIGDDVAAKNIKETLSLARKKGLTNLEINNLARTYGEVFGTKAFGKLGESLTSVNAKLYENTRKALKDLARSGIKGNQAKLADKTMSNLYKVKSLVQKNVEAVNKLQQKIRERGLLEKIGYNVAKYGNVLTGGTIRGLVGGVLPRGVGNKVMNALDIERVLEGNLKIIQDAIKSGNDKEIIRILKDLK